MYGETRFCSPQTRLRKKNVTGMYSVYRMIFDEFDMVPIYAVNKDRQI